MDGYQELTPTFFAESAHRLLDLAPVARATDSPMVSVGPEWLHSRHDAEARR